MADSVLIIDDHRSWLSVLNSILVQSGFDVRVADSPERGIQLAESDPPDIILLDIMMPRMNGLEVLAHFRDQSSLARTPIIIISARSDNRTQLEAISSGATGYMIKPVHPVELINRMRSLIRDAKRLEEE